MVANFLSVNIKIDNAQLPKGFEQVYAEVVGMFEGMTDTVPLHDCLLKHLKEFPQISTVLLPAYLPEDLPKNLSFVDEFSHLTFVKASLSEIKHRCEKGYFPDESLYNLPAEKTGTIYLILTEFVEVDAKLIVTAKPMAD